MGAKDHLNHENKVKQSQAAYRKRRAWDLLRDGYTMTEIARMLGVSVPSVSLYIKACLDECREHPLQTREDWLKIEGRRLDAMLKGIRKRALNGDDSAIDRVLKIMDRRAAMIGLDAPKRLDVEQTSLRDLLLATRKEPLPELEDGKTTEGEFKVVETKPKEPAKLARRKK